MKLLEILKFTEEYLEKYSFSKPRLESEKLISRVLKLDRISLYVNYEKELTETEKKEIKEYLQKMVQLNKKTEDILGEQKDFRHENLELLSKSISYLEKFGVPNAKLDAEYIFSDVLKLKRNILTLNFSREISEPEKDKIREMLVLRGKHRKPLQYILGNWEFFGYEFIVDERALIPRNDTEILVEQCKILLENEASQKILDIGTGSGAIALTLAKELPKSNVKGVDISLKAISLANENKKNLEVENVEFLHSDMFSNIKDEKFDLIVSNPPYISFQEYGELMPEVKNYEPRNALTDEKNGLYFYEQISKNSSEFLEENGYLVFEVGYDQAEKVKEIMESNKINVLFVIKDYGNVERVLIGRKGGNKEEDVN